MADGDLGQAEFDIAFTFSRPNAGSYRNGAGAVVEAAADAPRFDHDAQGDALGLLVEPGAYLGAADRAILVSEMLPAGIAGEAVTIFHASIQPGGTLRRRAWYSRNAEAAINSLLTAAGHHVSIGLIAGYRENRGGYVRYRAESWVLAGVLTDGTGAALTDGIGHPIIEG